jgi:magnesium-transporting ATPase (P-type)
LCLILPIGILINRFGPSKKLIKEKPISKLISKYVLTKIFGQVIIQAIFQSIVYFYVASNSSVPVPTEEDENNVENIRSTAMTLFSSFIYINMGILFCSRGPYRQNFSCMPFLICRAVRDFNCFLVCINSWNNFLLSKNYSRCNATLGNGFKTKDFDYIFGICSFFGGIYVSKIFRVKNIENCLVGYHSLRIIYHLIISLNYSIFLLISIKL